MSHSDTRKIAKNTMYMYLRMLILMVVSLYTTRINYRALGIDDFGIYNIVGSIIVFFTFINSGLTTATRRFITAELAQGGQDSQCNVFNIAIRAHLLISGIILVLGETVGLLAVNHLLNIPADRMTAANVVYQLSLLTAVLNVMQAPYTAVITANERMSIYAYLSIFEVLLKLAVAFCVLHASGDKLIVYAILITISSILVMFSYRLYCHRVFPMCHFKKSKNHSLFKMMFSYMGWSLAGQGAVVLTNQGVSVLVNTFFNVAANAAMGVSNQITGIVNNFVSNFQVAFHPQITKLYVSDNQEELNSLCRKCSRLSSYLVLVLLIPICFQLPTFLSIWLGDYPEYAVEFCIYTLIAIFIDSSAAPLWMILSSDSDIKKYQIIISSIYLLNFIGAWILLKLGFPPFSVLFVRILVYIIAIGARLKLVREHVTTFSIRKWIFEVPIHSLAVAIIPIVCGIFINRIVIDNIYLELLFKAGFLFIITAISIFCLGFNKGERRYIIDRIHFHT